jgi:hypothetical protein
MNVMYSSYPQLTPEQRQAIAASGGLPIHLEDPETHKLYVLLEQSPDALLDHEYICNELATGIAAIDAGERIPGDPEGIKQEGRRRLTARKSPE